MDVRDIEWRCECGHTTPDFEVFCGGCGKYRYYEEEAEIGQTACNDLTEVTAARQDEPRRQVEDNSAPRI